MRGKKAVFVIVGLAAASFAAAFGAGVFLKPPRQQAPPDKASAPAPDMPVASVPERPRLREQQLDDLAKALRQKAAEVETQSRTVEELSRRIQVAQEALRKDAQDLEAMRVSMMATLSKVQDAERQLRATRIQVAAAEKANIKRTANILAANAESGGRIILGMCDNRQEDEAVKILYFMSERAAANVLASITDPALAARLAEKLKRIVEEG